MIDRRLVAVTVLALIAVSLRAEAQPARPVRTIGIVGHTPATPFEEGLRDLGWVEGKNVRFERRLTTDDRTLAQFATELVRLRVDVVFAGNAAATRATAKITQTIPIITVSADPVVAGVAASLARPGTNVTGLAITQPMGKRLEILTQSLPIARRVALLANPSNPGTRPMRAETEAVAHSIGVQLLEFEASTPAQLSKVLASLVKARPDALLVTGEPLFWANHQDVLKAVARYRVPAMWDHQAFVDAGGLMSYGANPSELYRRAATFVDKILKGAKPTDLPIEQPTKFDLVINVKTASALGLTIPPPVLLRADHLVQ